jgi:cyclohexa-1,5-dienecarbonyl-CoA hydratase
MALATTFSRLTLDLATPAARLVLCHPPLNVIDITMMQELSQAIAEVESRPDIPVLVLQGEGKAFSVGVNVADHTPDQVAGMLSHFHAIFRALVATRKITIAAVHGHCLGGGAELAMICDLVYTTENASWGFPEIRLGCYPPVAATALASLIGAKAAADLILTGRTISGKVAAELRLANRAVADGQLDAAVNECLAHLAKLSPAALGLTKKAIYSWDSMHFDKGLARAEKIYLDELMKTEDATEGILSFLEKREPQWKNR